MKAKPRLLIAGIIVGSLLTLSPLIGLIGTIFGMTRAFNTLGGSGIGDPKQLSTAISTVLYSTAAGFILFTSRPHYSQPFARVLFSAWRIHSTSLTTATNTMRPAPLTAMEHCNWDFEWFCSHNVSIT